MFLEALGVHYIDESEVLTPADEEFHLLKSDFTVPFVCGGRDLGEAARRLGEGASMFEQKGNQEQEISLKLYDISVRSMPKSVKLVNMNEDELITEAKNLGAPYEILKQIKEVGRLPVVNYAAGGVATPADAALMMELGADGVFVGSGIFKSETPEKFANAIVQATANYKDYDLIGKLSKDLGTPMKGIDVATLASEERMQERGW